MAEKSWYYVKDNKPVGPILESKMHGMFQTGTLEMTTLVWTQPMPNWVPASTIESFRLNTTHSPAQVKSDTNENSWYYIKDNKPTGPISSSEIKKMLDSGNLGPETLVWSQSLSAWTPASKVELLLLRTTGTQVHLKQTIEVSNKKHQSIIRREEEPEMLGSENTFGRYDYHYTKDPASLTKCLKTMLWISLGISVLCLLSNFMQWNLISSGSFSQAQAESNDTRQRFIGFLYLGAFIVTGIAFLKWIYRSNLNCRGFGAQGMKFSPGWSIGYYFIPILCLYRPYQAMKEIWRVSENPYNWQNVMASPLLGWWWALWLIAGFLGQSSFRMAMSANTISSLQALTTALIVSGIIDIPLYIVAVSLVSGVYAKQEKLIRKHV